MNRKISLLVAISSLFFLAGLETVWGAGLVPCGGSGESPCTLCHLIEGFSRVTNYLTKLLVSVTLAGLFFSGVMYMISAGDSGMMETAKSFATASIKGFVIVLCAWLIVTLTLWIIGADFVNILKSNWYSFTFNCK